MYKINNDAELTSGQAYDYCMNPKLVLEVKLRNILFYSLSIISLLFIYCVHECFIISRVLLSHYIFISNGTGFVIFLYKQ